MSFLSGRTSLTTVQTADLADNAVTLAKMAGGTANQNISYDGSGDPQDAAISDINDIYYNLGVMQLQRAIDAGASYFMMVNTVADEYENSNGVNLTTSTGETYNTSGDYLSNPTGVNQIIGGTITFSTEHVSGNYDVENAFDDTNGTWWINDDNYGVPQWIKYDFGSGGAIVLDNFTIRANGDSNGRGLAAYTIDGSNDDAAWTTIASETSPNGTTSIDRTPSCSNTTAYRYYRLYMTSAYRTIGQGHCRIEKFSSYSTTHANMILISDASTAESEPDTVRVVILHEPVDSSTINVDYTTEVSIDGGTTWATATLADLGEFSSGINILAGTADVSAQTGTSIIYRHKIFNNKEQKFHGTWLQWSN